MAYQNCPFDVTPYDEANIVKTPNLVSVNYTNQDFWSMKSRLIDYIKEKFGANFNDFIESDLAIMLVENWAFIADTLSFKMDQIANEIFIDTVSEVDNAFRLAQLVGFTPQPPIAARSMWSATISSVLTTDLFITTPQVVDISTEQGPRTIELFSADSNNNVLYDQPIIITAGSFVNTSIVGLEGRTVNVQIPGNGNINQDYFTDSQPRREFRVEYDANYKAYVMFGNNRAGLIPSLGSMIDVSYRVGGGPAGNIITNAVEVTRNFLVPGFEFRQPVTFSNYTRGDFGYVGDSIDDVKRKLPLWLRTQSRVVSGDDYEIFANQFVTEFHGQIGKANAILRQHGCAANIVDLYVLALDGSLGLREATNELKVDLLEALETKKMITDHVCVKDGVVIEVDVTIDFTLSKFYRKFEDELREKGSQRTLNFFALNNWDYGKTLKAVDLIKELSDLRELSAIDVYFQTDNESNSGEVVTARFYEIVRPISIEINFVYE